MNKNNIDYEFWLTSIDNKLYQNKKIIKKILTIFSIQMILLFLQLIIMVLMLVFEIN